MMDMTDPSKFDRAMIASIFLEGVEYTDLPIAAISFDRKIVFCNRAWRRFHGVDEDEDCRGRDIGTVRDEVTSRVFGDPENTWKDSNNFQSRFYAEWTDQWIEITASRLEDLDPPVIIILLVDITETIEAHEERVKNLFRAMPIPIVIWKKEDGEIVLRDFNDAAMEFTRGKIEGLIGARIEDLYGDLPEILNDTRRCADEGVTIEREIEYRSIYDDWKRWLAVKYTFMPPDTVMVHAEDITERVNSVRELEDVKGRLEALVDQRTSQLEKINEQLRAEIEQGERTSEALARSERRYRSVSEQTSDYTYSGIVYSDGSMKREYVSGAFTKITGYQPEEIDDVLGRLQIVHALDKKIAEQQRLSYFSGNLVTSEFRIISKDGSVRWILSHGQAQEKTGDGGMRVFGAVKDITDRKNAELKLEDRNRELRILNIVGGLFDAAPDNDTALRKTLDLLLQEAEIDTAGIWALDRETDRLVHLYSRNMPERLLAPLKKIGPGDRYARALREAPGAFVFEEYVGKDDEARERIKEMSGVSRVIGLPVKTSGEIRVAFILGFPPDIDITDAKLDFFNVIGKQVGLEMEKQDLMKARDHQEKQLKKLARKLLTSAEDERATIAHELHDVIGQDIIAIKQRMPIIAQGIDPANKDAREAFLATEKELKDLATKIRDFSYSLAPPVLNSLGLKPAIEEYINNLIIPAGFEVELIITGFDERLPTAVERPLYRVAVEALTNVVRHSEAKFVVVRLIKGYPDVIMDIRDDGKGFLLGKGASEGLGITGMRQHVQNVRGRFEIHSSPGKGTHLRINIPLEVENEQ
ncbi:MAG TPA: PAS domain S-box protein [Candidatus Krumholzibacterium sp.]|nr:PAS domain S-box protein [Candidatus Krumholzibacterium sp.]